MCVWVRVCVHVYEPGDGESRALGQNSGEGGGGLLLGPVGQTHTKTLLSLSHCDTHPGTCSCEDVALEITFTTKHNE